MNYLAAPLAFLVDTVLSLYVFVLVLRMLFQWSGADPRNPVSQFLIRLTHPPLRLLRRVLPALGPMDTSSVFLVLLLQTSASYLTGLLQGDESSVGVHVVVASARLIELIFNIYFYAILFRSLLSWINPGIYNPMLMLLFSLTEPLLTWGRRLLPPTAGVDLSPLIPLVAIQFARMLLLPPLYDLARLLN